MDYTKKTKRRNKIKQKQTHKYREHTNGYQRQEGCGWVGEMGEGVNCMVKDDNQACGGNHFVVYIGVELQCCAPETYIYIYIYIHVTQKPKKEEKEIKMNCERII